jgi:hypothetical protein
LAETAGVTATTFFSAEITRGGIAELKISLGNEPHLLATACTRYITSAVSRGNGEVTFSMNLRFPTLEIFILSIMKASTLRPEKSTITFTPTNA